MAWIGVITNAGAALLAAWASGDHTLTISGATVGSGYVAEANMRIATALSSEKDDAEIVSAEEVTGGTQFRIRVSAIDGTSYTAHEIGIWGHLDDDDTETLIALHQDSATGVTVPTATSMPGFFFDLYCVHAIGNSGTLNITLSDTTFATRDELAQDVVTIESTTAPVELSSTASQAYSKGDYLIYNDKLYQASANISSGGTLTPGTNITQTTVAAELETLNTVLALSAFEVVIENNEYVLYWHGAAATCPFNITLENGEYVLNFVYTSAS